MDNPLHGYTMSSGFMAVLPEKRDSLKPEAGKFELHSKGKIIHSCITHEIGMDIIYDGSKSITITDEEYEIIPTNAILAYKTRGDK